ncbi:uncharacterized protein LOC117324635 [Pecten maximus]|uniref:uncharacterized protein LOC117324635 n=1 Tax=Pecten maximus TaxID=6579 RepID=UPI001458C329|nr:uncharacterized protein LOC117324635 [Pecten maximus]
MADTGGVQKEEYTARNEVNSEEIDTAFNSTKYINHRYIGADDPLRNKDKAHRKLLLDAGVKIEDEPDSLKQNLVLRIKLYFEHEEKNERVKYIEIKAGNGEKRIDCYLDTEGKMKWVYTPKNMLMRLFNQLKNTLFESCQAFLTVVQIIDTAKYLIPLISCKRVWAELKPLFQKHESQPSTTS